MWALALFEAQQFMQIVSCSQRHQLRAQYLQRLACFLGPFSPQNFPLAHFRWRNSQAFNFPTLVRALATHQIHNIDLFEAHKFLRIVSCSQHNPKLRAHYLPRLACCCHGWQVFRFCDPIRPINFLGPFSPQNFPLAHFRWRDCTGLSRAGHPSHLQRRPNHRWRQKHCRRRNPGLFRAGYLANCQWRG